MTRPEIEPLAFQFEVRLIPARESGGFVADVLAFPNVTSDGDTPEAAAAHAHEAVGQAIRDCLQLRRPRPEPAQALA